MCEQSSPDDQRTAFSRGYDARGDGDALDDCPYECIDSRYEHWCDGWRARDKRIARVEKFPKVKPS